MKSPDLRLADGSDIPLDEKGYLCDRSDWTPAVAKALRRRPFEIGGSKRVPWPHGSTGLRL